MSIKKNDFSGNSFLVFYKDTRFACGRERVNVLERVSSRADPTEKPFWNPKTVCVLAVWNILIPQSAVTNFNKLHV